MKAGWKTSEFWITIGSSVVAIAVLLGFVTTEESELIKNQAVQVVALGAPFVTATAALLMYIWGRVQIKRDMGKTHFVELDEDLKFDSGEIEFHHQ